MKTKTLALLLSLAVWLSLVQYGMTTARLGESESSYGDLDDSVRPFLVARYVYWIFLIKSMFASKNKHKFVCSYWMWP